MNTKTQKTRKRYTKKKAIAILSSLVLMFDCTAVYAKIPVIHIIVKQDDNKEAPKAEFPVNMSYEPQIIGNPLYSAGAGKYLEIKDLDKNAQFYVPYDCDIQSLLFPPSRQPRKTRKRPVSDNKAQDEAEDIKQIIELSAAEYESLCKIAYAEAHTEGLEGQELVAEVVINRVMDERFPSSIDQVISQEGQFQPYRNGTFRSAKPDDETKQAVDMALTGCNNSNGALYFKATYSKQKWKKKIVHQHGKHVFYI